MPEEFFKDFCCYIAKEYLEELKENNQINPERR